MSTENGAPPGRPGMSVATIIALVGFGALLALTVAGAVVSALTDGPTEAPTPAPSPVSAPAVRSKVLPAPPP